MEVGAWCMVQVMWVGAIVSISSSSTTANTAAHTTLSVFLSPAHSKPQFGAGSDSPGGSLDLRMWQWPGDLRCSLGGSIADCCCLHERYCRRLGAEYGADGSWEDTATEAD